MKIRPLPDTDLARIAPLPADRKRAELVRFKLGHPSLSYAPVRKAYLDILNVEAGPLFATARTPWHHISVGISKSSKSEEEAIANLAVAKSLYEFTDQYKLFGRKNDFGEMPIGISQRVQYWLSAIVEINSRPTTLFIDSRKTKRLDQAARRFVFSVMNERIRMSDPDYADVELGIIQLDSAKDGSRTPKLFLAADDELYGFDALDEMVRETYQIWQEVLAEREAGERGKDTGTAGPLFS